MFFTNLQLLIHLQYSCLQQINNTSHLKLNIVQSLTNFVYLLKTFWSFCIYPISNTSKPKNINYKHLNYILALAHIKLWCRRGGHLQTNRNSTFSIVATQPVTPGYKQCFIIVIIIIHHHSCQALSVCLVLLGRCLIHA